MVDEILDLGARELATLYRARGVSPVGVTQAALERIERLNHVVNAFCLVDAEVAISQARESERRFMEGTSRGPVEGVPVSIKDVLLTRGWPTLRGSTTVDPRGPWTEDSPAVARLREQGAVFVGKTTTPELGWKGVTDSPLTGITTNPWDQSRTAGGSSGGSAAALALGMAPLSMGTDGGGSVRIPGGFCGVVGFKATFGRVPVWPPSPFGTLSHVGPMARTVTDAALLLGVVSGRDPRDWTALPEAQIDYLQAIQGGVEGLRMAVSVTLGYVDVDPEVAAATERAAAVFEKLGAIVKAVDPGFSDPLETFEVHWYSGAAAAIRGIPSSSDAKMDPGLLEIAERGRGYSGQDLLVAAQRRADLATRMSLFHEEVDVLITPTLPIPAFTSGREVPEDWAHVRWMTWTPFTYPFNLTQQPAVTVPNGLTAAGLPIGLQLVGAKYADVLVLRAAHAFEETVATDRRPPLLTCGQ